MSGPGRSGLLFDESTLFERSRPGRTGVQVEPLPASVPLIDPQAIWGAEHVRDDIEGFPELSEFDVVRHFTRISQWNLGIDSAAYPLGSCTMKYNPKLNEVVAALAGFQSLHPLAPDEATQGILALGHALEQALIEISGLDRVTLQPAAGAQGEFVGMQLVQAYHRAHGGASRNEVIIPDTAHGTNPASAALSGMQVVEVKSGPDGTLTPEALAAVVGPRTSALMLTNPNTLGIFEHHVQDLANVIHEAGGLVYLDGANMNALLGVAKPGDMGVDVMHFNLHKTFSTPHGGGGPGSGPVAVRNLLAPYLPTPIIRKEGDRYRLDHEFPHSIGRVHAFYGNVGMWIRALAYIRSLGGTGLGEVTQMAVLNANYLLERLREHYGTAQTGRVMHECVLTDKLQQEHHVSTADIGKRLMDHGFHPPTIYFPLVIAGALMIEPTETESLDSLDGLADSLIAIAQEAKTDPEHVRAAPHRTFVRRVDEVRAARKPKLRWTPPERE